jgi:hypothetical protein
VLVVRAEKQQAGMKKKPNQVKQLQGKLGAMQRRLDEDRAFTFKEMALLEYEKTRAANLHRLLRSAIEAMERWPYLPDNVIYYFREGLKVTLEREEAEHQAKVKAREDLAKGGTDAADDHGHTPATP